MKHGTMIAIARRRAPHCNVFSKAAGATLGIVRIGIAQGLVDFKIGTLCGDGNRPHDAISRSALESRSQSTAVVTYKTKGCNMLAREKTVNALKHHFTSVGLWLTQVIPLTNLYAVMTQYGKRNRYMKVHIGNGMTQ